MAVNFYRNHTYAYIDLCARTVKIRPKSPEMCQIATIGSPSNIKSHVLTSTTIILLLRLNRGHRQTFFPEYHADLSVGKKCEFIVPVTNKSSAVAEMGDRANNRRAEKMGVLCPFRAELGSRLIQCGLGRGLLPYQVMSLSIQPFGHNKHGPKLVGVPSVLGVAGSPSNTM